MELYNTNFGQMLIVIFLIINISSFVVMARDKQKATSRQNDSRIPEGLIFFLASAFGAVGVYIAMLSLRHKTRKWYFRLGIPLLICQNIASVYTIWKIVTGG